MKHNPALGDANDFLKNNLSLVHHMAKQFRNVANGPFWDYDDLIAIGNIGLLRAYEDYDPKRGLQFSTFAGFVIRNEFLKHCRLVKKTSRVQTAEPILVVDDHGHELELLDTLEGGNIDTTRITVNDFIQTLKPSDKTILYMRLNGFKQEDIAAQVGVSQSIVSRRLKKIYELYQTG